VRTSLNPLNTADLDLQKSSGRSMPVFLVLFFVSGVCTLIYEVAWTRLFTVLIGNTVWPEERSIEGRFH
jgi:hypothetical protein